MDLAIWFLSFWAIPLARLTKNLKNQTSYLNSTIYLETPRRRHPVSYLRSFTGKGKWQDQDDEGIFSPFLRFFPSPSGRSGQNDEEGFIIFRATKQGSGWKANFSRQMTTCPSFPIVFSLPDRLFLWTGSPGNPFQKDFSPILYHKLLKKSVTFLVAFGCVL